MGENKKMGRPTTNPKTSRLELRISNDDIEKLNFCSKASGLSKAEVIRKGIDKVYNEIKRQ